MIKAPLRCIRHSSYMYPMGPPGPIGLFYRVAGNMLWLSAGFIVILSIVPGAQKLESGLKYFYIRKLSSSLN